MVCSKVVVAPHLVVLHLERNPIYLYHAALKTALAFFVLSASITVTNAIVQYDESSTSRDGATLALCVVQLSAGIVSLLLSLLFPRRPSVFVSGQLVDKQHTVSALNRYCFGWANSLLKFAKTHNGLDLKDLPNLDFNMRSAQLHSQLAGLQGQDRLWKTLLRAHYPEAMVQTFLSTVHGVLTFAPSLAMYKLLQLLEERSEGETVDSKAWAWIIGLGLSVIIMNWNEAWLFWIVCEWARKNNHLQGLI